jgi:Cof subfamily protein (haloacid dehalogenase superfamily)
VRLIAMDLDGTLFRADRSIGPRTINALRAAHARGVAVVLASGRMTAAMESAADQLGLDVYIVSYNGAAVCNLRAQGRQRLFHQPLPKDISREICLLGKERGYQINFYYEEVVVSEDGPRLRPWIDLYRTRTGSPFRIVERLVDYFLKYAPTKLLFCLDPAARNIVYAELLPRFHPRRALLVRTDPEYLEFLNPEVDKGKGVRMLAQSLGIAAGAVLALGDGENDISMLSAAGWGVAVANAGDCCKSVADAITTNDNNNDAVAEAVERWVLKD